MRGLKINYTERIQTMDQLIREMSRAVESTANSTQVEVSVHVGLAFALGEQCVGCELRGPAQTGVGVEDHLGEVHLVEPEVAADASEVHRRDVPSEVCPELRAVRDIEQCAADAGIEHTGHRHVAGLQCQTVQASCGLQVDAERFGRVAGGQALGHVGSGEQEDVLAAQRCLEGSLEVTLQGGGAFPVEP